MTALLNRPARGKVAVTRRIRFDAPARPEIDSASLILRFWAARQAARYQDLLLTIAAAPKPVPPASK
jgi:hypothetical protein